MGGVRVLQQVPGNIESKLKRFQQKVTLRQVTNTESAGAESNKRCITRDHNTMKKSVRLEGTGDCTPHNEIYIHPHSGQCLMGTCHINSAKVSCLHLPFRLGHLEQLCYGHISPFRVDKLLPLALVENIKSRMGKKSERRRAVTR